MVTPQFPCPAWEIADRKQKNVYPAQNFDIVVGLVRPERRNIGLLLNSGDDIVASPDGIALVRVKKEFEKKLPQLWIFQALRSESTRLQLWTESGGTSYGKLASDHIRQVKLARPTDADVEAISVKVGEWATSLRNANRQFEQMGSENDRYPIINSPIFGLEPVDEPWK